MIDLKKLIKKEAEKAILSKTVGKILPMDDVKPKIGKNAKIVSALTLLAAAVGAALSYFQG